MRKNPYGGGTQYKTPQRAIVATDFKLQGSREQFVGHDGHINASNKQDLAMQIARAMQMVNSPNGGIELLTEESATQREQKRKIRREIVQAAFQSKDRLSEAGVELAAEINITSNRDGFMRRFFTKQDLADGQWPHARMRYKNTTAILHVSAIQIETQVVRDQEFFPQEDYITARLIIPKLDLVRTTDDLLDEKFIEGLEAVMVTEDRYFLRLANNSIGTENNFTNIVGTMTPLALGALRNQVTRWGIPARFWLIANDLWTDMIGGQGFFSAEGLEPMSRHELMIGGYLGTLLGMDIISDAFRHPGHKVLEQGEMYVIGDPSNLGQFSDRGGIESQPIDITHERIPGKGWVMNEIISMILVNARGIAKGKRVPA